MIAQHEARKTRLGDDNTVAGPAAVAAHADEAGAGGTCVVRVDPRWGEDYLHGAIAYVTPLGVQVWLHRKGQRVRFFDAAGGQVGPEHTNLYPATIWAAAHGWIDPNAPALSVACITQVRRQLAEREQLAARDRVELDRSRPEFAEALR